MLSAIIEKLDTIINLLNKQQSTSVNNTWLELEDATKITGLKKTALLKNCTTRGGTINIQKAGNRYRYNKSDCLQYALKKSTLS
jgi:hypothetical protein